MAEKRVQSGWVAQCSMIPTADGEGDRAVSSGAKWSESQIGTKSRGGSFIDRAGEAMMQALESVSGNPFILLMFFLIDLTLVFLVIQTLHLLIIGGWLSALRWFAGNFVVLILQVTFLTVFIFGGSPSKFSYIYTKHAASTTKQIVSILPIGDTSRKSLGVLVDNSLKFALKVLGHPEKEKSIKEEEQNIRDNLVFYKKVKEGAFSSFNVNLYSQTQQRAVVPAMIFSKQADIYFVVNPNLLSRFSERNPEDYSVAAVFSDKYTQELSGFQGGMSMERPTQDLVAALITIITPEDPRVDIVASSSLLKEIYEDVSATASASSQFIHGIVLKTRWNELDRVSQARAGTVLGRIKNMDVHIVMEPLRPVGFPSHQEKLLKARIEKKIDAANERIGPALVITGAALAFLEQYSQAWEYATLKTCADLTIIDLIEESARRRGNSALVTACGLARDTIDRMYNSWLDAFSYSVTHNMIKGINDFADVLSGVIEVGRQAKLLGPDAAKIGSYLGPATFVLDTTILFWDTQTGAWMRTPLAIADIADFLMFDIKETTNDFANNEVDIDEFERVGILVRLYFKAGYVAYSLVVEKWNLFSPDSLNPANFIFRLVVNVAAGESLETARKEKEKHYRNCNRFASYETLDKSLYTFVHAQTKSIEDIALQQ